MTDNFSSLWPAGAGTGTAGRGYFNQSVESFDFSLVNSWKIVFLIYPFHPDGPICWYTIANSGLL